MSDHVPMDCQSIRLDVDKKHLLEVVRRQHWRDDGRARASWLTVAMPLSLVGSDNGFCQDSARWCGQIRTRRHKHDIGEMRNAHAKKDLLVWVTNTCGEPTVSR